MLLILAFLYLLQCLTNTHAAPLSINFARQATIDSPLSQECVYQNLRSIWDIVQSCFVTIFACSWVSVHPNIPGKGEPRWKKGLRRVELMVWSIIAPELIIYWAMRQWIGARRLAKKYREVGWKMTHGYFIQMGGFMLYDGEKAVGVLSPERLDELLAQKSINMPTITAEDIQDRSKGDGLSKALVVIQTTWFIAQCMARTAQGLVITELELVTLAFATLNGVMYFLWWNKALDVQSVVPVYLKPASIEGNDLIEKGESQAECKMSVNDDGSESKDEIDPERENLIISPGTRTPSQRRATHNISFVDLACKAWWLLSGVLFRWPAFGVGVILKRMGKIMATRTMGEGKMRVHTFYACAITSDLEGYSLFSVLALIGTIFGAIHCAGWGFFFPSLIEANIWRISSTIITGVPLVGFLIEILGMLNDYYFHEDNGLVQLFGNFLAHMTIFMLPVYVLARFALLVEALISLRDLPPGALQVVEWTTFLPHI